MAYVKDPGEEYVRKTNRFVLTVLAAAVAVLVFIVVYTVKGGTGAGLGGEIPRLKPTATLPDRR